MKHTQRQPPNALVPMIGVARNVGVGEVVRVGSEEDSELLAPSAGLLGLEFGVLTSDSRMIQKMQHLIAREAPERKPQQQRDRFPHRAFAAGAAIDDIHRQLMKPRERAFEVGQIIRVERVWHDHARSDGNASHRDRATSCSSIDQISFATISASRAIPGQARNRMLCVIFARTRNRPAARSGSRFRMSSCRLPSSEVAFRRDSDG